MKNLIFKTVMGITTTLALAMPLSAMANDDLKAIMKQTGKDYKALGMQISNSSQNASSIALTSDISAQLKKAHELVPDTVDELSGAQRDTALTEYQNDINDVMTLVDQITAALQAGDNSTAAAILSKVSEQKKSDHDKFNPQP